MFPLSKLRKLYMARLVGRCGILALCIWFFFTDPSQFAALTPGRFFERFTPLHLLWMLWMVDMLGQLMPLGRGIALGSMKLFERFYRPAAHTSAVLRSQLTRANRRALLVLVIWATLILTLGGLHAKKLLTDAALFVISVFFYVCDLICVLIWCPFRLLLGNRCCTTCRIFNWDHMMMFTPLLFVGGFFALSLNGMAFLVLLAWETALLRHPERFFSLSNAALQCSSCTDKLCTQYCGKKSRKVTVTTTKQA